MLRFAVSIVLYTDMEQEQFKNEILPMRNRLIAYALRLTENEDDAEDIVQEVFLKLWFMRDRLSGYENIPSLAFTVAKHLSLDLKKRKRHECEELSAEWQSEDETPLQELEHRDEVERLMSLIDELPDLQQSILRMKHLEGLETEEIAALSGCSVEAVRMNLSRARKKIRDKFFENN